MRRLILAWLLAVPVWTAAPAAAKTCTLDVVPAATLLLPYFEVDLQNPSGRNTLMSIHNASARPVLARLSLWTDLGISTLGFDIYLTGYDVQTLSLRDIFNGVLPRTADDPRDPNDTISPRGEVSQDGFFPGCQGILPPPALPGSFVDHLAKSHQGLPSLIFQGKCAAQAGLTPARRARGYVTVDVVRRCSLLMPADAGYFGPDGVIGHDNVLWGDFILVDPSENLAQGENLVRIESDPARFAGRPTFYERFVGSSGADGREPLPTLWGARYLNGGVFTGGTDLIYWRDSRMRTEPFLCHQLPAWYPIQWNLTGMVVFDEEETPDAPTSLPGIPLPLLPSPFPAESGRIRVGGPALPVPFDFGWWYFDMKNSPNALPALSQSWLGSLHQAQGRFSVGLEAEALDSGCSPRTIVLGMGQ